MQFYLAVCGVFRDEALYLREWIDFHRAVGCEYFFLYNNFGSDDFRSVLTPYVDNGIVTLVDWPVPFRKGGQTGAYRHCVVNFGGTSRWIAFLDIDEFLFAPGGPGLNDVLPDYERFPGVVVNWQVYGSSGHVEKPKGLVTDNFVRRAETQWPRNRRVKSIVDPRRTVGSNGPHFFTYRDDEPAVTENCEPVQIIRSKKEIPPTDQLPPGGAASLDFDPYGIRHSSAASVSVNRLRINHYVVKSQAEYSDKMNRYNKSTVYGDFHFDYHDRNEVYDPVLQGLIS